MAAKKRTGTADSMERNSKKFGRKAAAYAKQAAGARSSSANSDRSAYMKALEAAQKRAPKLKAANRKKAESMFKARNRTK